MVRSTKEHQPVISEEKDEVQVEMGKKLTMWVTHENNSILQIIQSNSSFGKLVEFFSYVSKFIQMVKQKKKQIPSTKKTQPKLPENSENYKWSTENNLHLPRLLSSTDELLCTV